MPTIHRQSGSIPVLTVIICGFFFTSCAKSGPDSAPPPASLSELFGDELHRADGSRTETRSVNDKEIIAIYFSAQWCPPCRQFTPILVQTANELQEAGKSFEVILVSSDRSEKDMFAYMTGYKMPWLAMPHGDAKAAALSARYGVRGIPMLVVIDNKGNTLSLTGRADVTGKGVRAYDDWQSRRRAAKQ